MQLFFFFFGRILEVGWSEQQWENVRGFLSCCLFAMMPGAFRSGELRNTDVLSKLSVWHLCQIIRSRHDVCIKQHANSGQDIWTERKLYDLYSAYVRCRQPYTTAQKFDQNAIGIAIFITSAKLFRLGYHNSTCSVCAYISWNARVYPSIWQNAIPSSSGANLCKTHYRHGRGVGVCRHTQIS